MSIHILYLVHGVHSHMILLEKILESRSMTFQMQKKEARKTDKLSRFCSGGV